MGGLCINGHKYLSVVKPGFKNKATFLDVKLGVKLFTLRKNILNFGLLVTAMVENYHTYTHTIPAMDSLQMSCHAFRTSLSPFCNLTTSA